MRGPKNSDIIKYGNIKQNTIMNERVRSAVNLIFIKKNDETIQTLLSAKHIGRIPCALFSVGKQAMAVTKPGACRMPQRARRPLACAVSVVLFDITHTPRTCKYDMPARRQKVVTGWAGLMVSFVVFEQRQPRDFIAAFAVCDAIQVKGFHFRGGADLSC